MAHILICADDITVESLLVVIAKHMGHDPEVLGPAPSGALPAGDLFLADPTAPRSTAWATALRHRDAAIPVVAIGLDPLDPGSLGFEPSEIVDKPFRVDVLREAIERALRPD